MLNVGKYTVIQYMDPMGSDDEVRWDDQNIYMIIMNERIIDMNQGKLTKKARGQNKGPIYWCISFETLFF